MHPRTLYCVAVVGTGLVVALFTAAARRGPNPFATDTRRPPPPRPKDRAECDALDRAKDRVLRNIYRPAKVPPALDAIVIGSGIGGLSAAAFLAKAGKRVLVLEQHDQAGGCCHSFRENGYKFDPGIHYVGDMHDKDTLGFLMGQLTEGQLEWAPLDPDYDVVVLEQEQGPPRRIPITAVRRIEVLKAHFPAAAKALSQWHTLLWEAHGAIVLLVLFKTLPRWLTTALLRVPLLCLVVRRAMRLLQTSPHSVVQKLTSDADLQTVLNYCWGDHGVPPRRASFATHAMILNHYERGAFYPVGGSDHIAYTLIPPITRAGGAVLVKAPVASVVVEGGRAVGVRLLRGDVLRAPTIISSAGLHATLTQLLPPPLRPTWPAQYPLSTSFLSLFVGLRGSAQELGLAKSQYWCYTRPDADAALAAYDRGGVMRAQEEGFPLLFVTFPSAKEPLEEVRNPYESTCTVLALMPYEWFEEWRVEAKGKRAAEYEELKAALGRRMWQQTCEYFPQLVDRVEHFSVGSPLTNEHFLAAPQGAIYGLEHGKARFAEEGLHRLRLDCANVPGLWLTGQDMFSCGFGGALMGGLLTGGAVLGRNLYADLLALKWRCAASEMATKVLPL